jgi:hypothetical protein
MILTEVHAHPSRQHSFIQAFNSRDEAKACMGASLPAAIVPWGLLMESRSDDIKRKHCVLTSEKDKFGALKQVCPPFP